MAPKHTKLQIFIPENLYCLQKTFTVEIKTIKTFYIQKKPRYYLHNVSNQYYWFGVFIEKINSAILKFFAKHQ